MKVFELYLDTPNGLVPTGERYDNLQDTKEDYPWTIFDVFVRGKILVAKVHINKSERKTMKERGIDGWCY